MENTMVFMENFETESRKVEFGMTSEPEVFMTEVDVANILIVDETGDVLPF